MQDTSNVFAQFIAKLLYVVEVPCPECGGEMHAWRNKRADGKERCAPVCMSCGYKSLKKSELKTTERIFNDSLKTKAMNYLKYSSLLTNKELLKCRLINYLTNDKETLEAKELANRAVEDILTEKLIHVIWSGKSGVGKSHLSMGIAWEVLQKSNYNKRCLFVSYSELLSQLKFAFNDERARRDITGVLMSEVKACDVLVLDDLGAELGIDVNTSTTYNNDTLNQILEARQNKTLIVTTNLSSEQLIKAYGNRILSRLMNNSQDFVFKFEHTTDKRLRGVS